jgi:hypothetical protein
VGRAEGVRAAVPVPHSFQRLAGLSLACCGLDALVLGQGLVSVGLLILSLVAVLPHALLLRHLGRPAQHSWRLMLSMFGGAAASLVLIALNNALARERGAELVTAVETFRSMQGRYPVSLQELVPTQLDAVPRAKLQFIYASFDYRMSGDRWNISYTTVPPYGTVNFDSGTREWVERP